MTNMNYETARQTLNSDFIVTNKFKYHHVLFVGTSKLIGSSSIEVKVMIIMSHKVAHLAKES